MIGWPLAEGSLIKKRPTGATERPTVGNHGGRPRLEPGPPKIEKEREKGRAKMARRRERERN